MHIDLINDQEVKTGRGTGKKPRGGLGKKYKNYRLAIENILPFLKESLEQSKNNTIRIRLNDIAKEMGDKFKNKHSTSLMWGLKFTLFNEGIMVRSGKHNDGSDILIMTKRNEHDTLPPSLEIMRKENEKKDKENKNKK